MKPSIQIQGADNGDATPASWFDGNTAEGTVYPDGKIDCKDFASSALKLWGYTSDQDFLSSLGYSYSNNTWNGTGDTNTRMQYFRNAVGLKVYGHTLNGDPTVDGSALYELYLHNFLSSDCKARDLGIYPTSNSSYNDLVKNRGTEPAAGNTTISNATGIIQYTAINVVSSDGQKTETDAFAYNSSTDSTYTAEYYSTTNSTPTSSLLYGYQQNGAGSVTMSCDDLAKGISTNAPAWVIWRRSHPSYPVPNLTTSTDNSGGNGSPSPQNTCAITGIGWLVCPVVRFLGGVADQAYGAVKALLQTQPLNVNVNDPNNGSYIAWSYMRNFANVAFVIAFLVIIYSQLTGLGVSNYGLKKLLPKLVIAAILVNVSYWLCAIAIDLSNIVGYFLKAMIDSITTNIHTNNVDVASGNFWSGGDGQGGVIAAVLAGTAVAGMLLYLGLSILLPVLIAVISAIVTVLIVLILRQALIILLVFVAPLAFVALLLPNTENLFKRWRELFTTMLVMYPIIAFIFAGSALASKVILVSTDGNGSTESQWFLQITAAGVTVIPLFLAPMVMKLSGSLLGRFAGIVNNPNKGMFDRMRKRADGFRDRQENARAIRSLSGKGNKFLRATSFGKYQRAAKREAIDTGIKAERAHAQQQYIAGQISSDGETATRFGARVAGGNVLGLGADPSSISRALANAKYTIEKAEIEEVKAEAVMLTKKGDKELIGEIENPASSPARVAAALERLVKISDPDKYEKYVDKYGGAPEGSSDAHSRNDVIRKTLANTLSENGPQFLKAMDIDKIASGKMGSSNFKSIAQGNLADGVLSPEKIVADSNGNLKYAFKIANEAGRRKMEENAAKAQTIDTLSAKIKHNAATINSIARGVDPNIPDQVPGQGTLF